MIWLVYLAFQSREYLLACLAFSSTFVCCLLVSFFSNQSGLPILYIKILFSSYLFEFLVHFGCRLSLPSTRHVAHCSNPVPHTRMGLRVHNPKSEKEGLHWDWLTTHTVRNLHFLSKNSALISLKNRRIFGGEKLVKMLWFWTF